MAVIKPWVKSIFVLSQKNAKTPSKMKLIIIWGLIITFDLTVLERVMKDL